MSVTLPDAALLLSQGAGRLVRRVEDKGVLAILDSRLVTARYGSLLRSVMSEFWFSTDLEIVSKSLNNLSEVTKYSSNWYMKFLFSCDIDNAVIIYL